MSDLRPAGPRQGLLTSTSEPMHRLHGATWWHSSAWKKERTRGIIFKPPGAQGPEARVIRTAELENHMQKPRGEYEPYVQLYDFGEVVVLGRGLTRLLGSSFHACGSLPSPLFSSWREAAGEAKGTACNRGLPNKGSVSQADQHPAKDRLHGKRHSKNPLCRSDIR